MAFDSSTGFRLPDGSVPSPDASLVVLERWQALSADERQGFAPLCPNLVVELAGASGASTSDEGPGGLAALYRKRTDDQGSSGKPVASGSRPLQQRGSPHSRGRR